MPSRSQISLPSPTNEYEFEDITRDYCEIKYGHAELHGRRGQAQHGINIYCQVNKCLLCVQCKCYKSLTITDVDDIVNKAKGFPARIDTLIIATTAQRDSVVQEHVIAINQINDMNILLLYWDTISKLLMQNPSILRLHYPDEYCDFSASISIDDHKITEKYIKDKFNEAIQCFNVIPFIKIDPTYGIPRGLPYDIDIFCYEISDLLERGILLQETDIYKNVLHFTNKLQDYNAYLSNIMYPTKTGLYTMQSEYDWQRIDEIRKEDYTFKVELDKLYGKVNKCLHIL